MNKEITDAYERGNAILDKGEEWQRFYEKTLDEAKAEFGEIKGHHCLTFSVPQRGCG